MTNDLSTDSDPAALVGTWKLASCFMEDVETGQRSEPWGERPNGFLVLTADRRWVVIQTGTDRPPPHSEADRAAAFQTMLAYSGRYRVDGDRLLIDVDIAWDESWTGSQQVRQYRLDGDALHIIAAPQAYANFGGRVLRGILIWHKDGSAGAV